MKYLIALLFALQIGICIFGYQKYKKVTSNYWTLQQQYIDVQNEKEELDQLQTDVVIGILDEYDEDMATIADVFYEFADIVDDNTARVVELERKQDVIINYLR